MNGQQQEQEQVVLNPQPLFGGRQLERTKIFQGMTLRQVLEQSEEALQALGITPGADLSGYDFQCLGADGSPTQLGLDHVIQSDESIQATPTGFTDAEGR